MSSNKRPFGLLGVRGSNSSKRAKSPAPQARLAATLNPNQSSSPLSASKSTSTNAFQAGISRLEGAKAAGHVVWSTLKSSMKYLRRSCQLFPPLESAVENLVDALECIEDSTYSQAMKQDDEELRKMASDLPQWVVMLSVYLSDPGSQPERISKLVKNLAKDLSEQAKDIKAQQQRGERERPLDAEGLRRCYSRIETSFRQLQTDASLSAWKIADGHLKESRLNALSPAHDARYDSSFSNKIERGACFQNTRVSVLGGIRGWIYSASDVKIYWTNGMAGTGKTTIAYSICAELEQHGRLGASYFCSRASSECQDVSRILPTIAYQLAQQFYQFRSSLCRILSREANIGQRNISVQFEHLIRTPLLEVKDLLPSGLVIVIDALDECSDPRTMEMMLDALFFHAATLPIRFFVTSRPEPSITNNILARESDSRTILHLHNVEEHFVKVDIEIYLTIMLAKLSLDKGQIKQLAQQAGILFIYAATVAKYLLASGGANVSTRLAKVLTGDTNQNNMRDQEIDRLYKTILDGALKDGRLEEVEAELIKRVLWTVVCVKESVTKGTLAALLKVNGQQVSEALQPLLSVLHVSEGGEVVSVLHASFPDFMLSLERCGPLFYCDETKQNSYLAARCFELMEQQLKFNICDLETSYQFDEDVPDIEARVKAAISPELFYVCRYWAEHLRQASFCDKLLTCLNEFLDKRLLFWMEVLNLKKCMNGPKILAETQNWLSEGGVTSDTCEFVHDARSFVTTFAANPVRRSTPHIYVSVLPLVPRQSKVWESYWGRTKGLLQIDGTLINRREMAALAMWEIGHGVTTMTYSPDGAYIAFASADDTIRVWDGHSGIPLYGPLQGHNDTVTSVAFSFDGTRIVSGSRDGTIRVWDSNGNLLGNPFKGHTKGVSSVAFSPKSSPNSSWIISGSEDCTIRTWDISGTPLGGPLTGHTHGVTSVAFAPDGMRIVSGSLDCTVRMWDVRSGTPLSDPFKGPAKGVTSVAFSPDGTRIVSGSLDCTVWAWDVNSGTRFGSPFWGHTKAVTSIAFSPDSTCIVSGSYDCTIRVWDVYSGLSLGNPFKGHTKTVTSVAFSPDGTRIISGSYDCTIRVWDMHRAAPLASGSSLDYHSNAVTSVAFSPDCTRIASASLDCTIRVWDVRTGTPLGIPFRGHTDAVWSVAFSPDSTCIVSGSLDRTVRMWDAYMCSGTLLGNPFNDHTSAVWSVAFSPDGTRIVSGSRDGTIRVWDVRTGTLLGSLFNCHTKGVSSVAFSPNSSWIISGSEDCTIRIWDIINGIPLGSPLKGHTNGVTSVAFSPDGMRIVSGSLDCTVWMWDVYSGTPLGDPFKGPAKGVTSVAFSPDGTRIVSGSLDCTVWVWGVCSATRLGHPFKGHTNLLSSVAFSSDGAHIVSGSLDRTIRVWDLQRPQPQTTSVNKWSLNDEGWVMDSTSYSRLFWLPAELRNTFPMPPNALTVSPNGSIKAELIKKSLGESWNQCYKPQVPPYGSSSV